MDQDRKISAVLSLYNAFFHCARALLFKDGITERSHFCVMIYLEHTYAKKGRLSSAHLVAFETTMALRNEAQYSTDPLEIVQDLAELASLCEGFIGEVTRLCSP